MKPLSSCFVLTLSVLLPASPPTASGQPLMQGGCNNMTVSHPNGSSNRLEHDCTRSVYLVYSGAGYAGQHSVNAVGFCCAASIADRGRSGRRADGAAVSLQGGGVSDRLGANAVGG